MSTEKPGARNPEVDTERGELLLDQVRRVMRTSNFGSGAVKDVDFTIKQITVRSGKGNNDRFTTFAGSIIPLLGHNDLATTMIYTHVL